MSAIKISVVLVAVLLLVTGVYSVVDALSAPDFFEIFGIEGPGLYCDVEGKYVPTTVDLGC
jgi:hypothetical protein